MDKKEFLNSLEEIVKGTIHIADGINQLTEEIAQNHWSFSSYSCEERINIDELKLIITRIKQNRINQLNDSNVNTDLIYYSWYDGQSGNFNFNLINSSHNDLPFQGSYQIIDKEEEIFHSYMKDTSTEPLLIYKEILIQTKLNKSNS